MRDSESPPPTADGAPPRPLVAAFRPRLTGLVLGAVGVSVLAWAGLGLASSLDHVLPIAAGIGLAWFLVRVLTHHLREGIVADAAAILDVGRAIRIEWDEVASIRFDVVAPQRADGPAQTPLRVVAVEAADGRRIVFGDFSPYHGSSRLGEAFNTAEASLLLAIVAARTSSEGVYPDAWHAPAPETSTPAAAEAADGPAVVTTDAAAAEAAREAPPGALAPAWGLIALAFKIVPKVGGAALKLLKAFKPGAAALTVGVYTILFSWKFAIALVVMVGVHECGHVWAMWRSGVTVRGIYLLPFIGGAAVADGIAGTRAKNAYIDINGPIWGSILAALCFGAWLGVGTPEGDLLGAAAAWGALLNLFNLLPIMPLDGGRILNDVSFSLGSTIGTVAVFASLLFGGAVAYVLGFELLVLMLFIGALELGVHLAAAPYTTGVPLLGGRRLTFVEHEHFQGLVATVQPGRTTDRRREAREKLFDRHVRQALQTPMTGGQVVLVLAGYAVLVIGLVAILWSTTSIEEAGHPIELFR